MQDYFIVYEIADGSCVEVQTYTTEFLDKSEMLKCYINLLSNGAKNIKVGKFVEMKVTVETNE